MNKFVKLGMRAVLAALILFLSAECGAQTISPLVSEYGKVAKGRFQITNNSDRQIAVVLEPKSFTLDPDGNVSYRALDQQIQVKLSASSFRINPQSTYYVFYEARSEKVPNAFVIYSNITGLKHQATGLNVRLDLPHTVYLIDGIAKRDEITATSAFDAASKSTILTLANTGSRFARVIGIEYASGRTRETSPGFPLFPGSIRVVRIPWNREGIPDQLLVRLSSFTLKENLSGRRNPEREIK